MKAKNPGRTPVYDPSMKVAAATEYLTGNQSLKELGIKYGVPTNTISHFVRWYRKHYAGGKVVQPQAAQGATGNEKQLSIQLKEANLKIAGLEMLIEIAQKELGVDIIKKPGTKQSPK
jgi:transposase-like protein